MSHPDVIKAWLRAHESRTPTPAPAIQVPEVSTTIQVPEVPVAPAPSTGHE